jgi:hypothetical protein
MRRMSLLALALAATTYAAPAARAGDPLCAAVWAAGTAVPPGSPTVSVCVPYPFEGRYCGRDMTGVEPDIVVYDTWCIPLIIGAGP